MIDPFKFSAIACCTDGTAGMVFPSEVPGTRPSVSLSLRLEGPRAGIRPSLCIRIIMPVIAISGGRGGSRHETERGFGQPLAAGNQGASFEVP
jgi:hypothetical protein